MRLVDLLAARKLEGKRMFQGLPISIETDKGSVREGVDKDTGEPWHVKMSWPYGYLRKTEGVDGDHVDCFIGPNEQATHAYVIHSKNPHTGKYDEDKCMLGFDNPAAAKEAFLDNYSDPGFFGSLEAIPMDRFKEKVFATKDNPQKIAAGGPGSGCRGSNCGRPKLELYRGIDARYVKDTLKHGLVTHNAWSADEKGTKVFVTRNKQTALGYADFHRSEGAKRLAVVVLHGDKVLAADPQHKENRAQNEIGLSKPIAAEHIHRIEIYNTKDLQEHQYGNRIPRPYKVMYK
jgi:hypothetical protein